MNSKVLITSLGWEPRFLLGMEDILSNYKPDHVVIFKPSTFFLDVVEKNKADLSSKLDSLGIHYTYYEFSSDNHVEVWNLALNVSAKFGEGADFVLDITTMPRYLILACLHGLENTKSKFKYIYYPPLSYGDWLSSDTGKPQMVFRHSGIAYPDLPTCLFLFSGFDLSRAQHFVDFFEPKKIILVTQQGDQLDNTSRCVRQLSGGAEIKTEQLNAYSDPVELKNQMHQLVKSDLEEYNVVATSVGPRPSIISLYLLNREEPSIGLVHANAHQYNKDYSFGIDVSRKFESVIDFSVSRK
jgi:hypothetical protein